MPSARPHGSPPPLAPPAFAGAVAYLGAVAEVDLWRIDLDLPVAGAAALLDPEERERAGRFAFERDRARFTSGRAALRVVLAGYAGAPAETLAFARGAYGKPRLPGGPSFSFSNSQGCGLVAVGRDRDVGVDVEQLREVPEAVGIAATLFSPEEREAWHRAGGDVRGAFLRIWTRKEAALKALGLGLSGADHPPPERHAVEIHDLDLDPDHAAALAIVRRD